MRIFRTGREGFSVHFRHRQNAAKELPVEASSKSLEQMKTDLADVHFLRAMDGSWQPLKRYPFYATNADKDRIQGWPKDARRFFAEPPLGAANPAARKDIWHLMEWLGMRTSPPLLKRALYLPVEAGDNYEEVRTNLVTGIQKLQESMAERLQDGDVALFQQIEAITLELDFQEVQQLSIDQVLVADADKVKDAEIDVLRSVHGMTESLVEFKPMMDRLVPIARIKELSENTSHFVGKAEERVVFTFKGDLMQAMKDASKTLAKATLWSALQKLPLEDQKRLKNPDSKEGLADKALSFVFEMGALINAMPARPGSKTKQTATDSQPVLPDGEIEDLQPSMAEDEDQSDVAPMEKLLALHKEFEDLEDDDFFESLASAASVGAEDSEGDYPAVEAPVEDLLEQAENALNYRRRKQRKKSSTSSKSATLMSKDEVDEGPPPVIADDAADVLSPNLPYSSAADSLKSGEASRSRALAALGF
eukprot:symbB.v1.2.036694.t1/scaffold5235.1/size29511/1